MGLELFSCSKVFRESLEASALVLQPLGIDLMASFLSEDGWATTTIASVGLIALQIGLVDMLAKEYGVKAHGWLGHSAGEC